MNILVLNGSPRKNGNTAAMVAAFAEGARAAGNDVTVVEVAHLGISGCRACEHCHTVTLGQCIIRDDMQQLYPLLQAADMLVLASPIYYFGYTAQLQAAIHRTYALGPLTNLKKTALILSSGSDDVYEGAIYEYRKAFVEWMHAEDAGVFTAFGAKNKSKEKLAELRAFGASLGDVASSQEGNTMKITVNGTELNVVLEDNSSVKALKELLADGPITVSMRDYANMEKVGDLGTTLPANDTQITTQAGDVILYQSRMLVIYYAPNSWSFTRLGKIEGVDAQQLKSLLGGGDVVVTLEL